MTLNVTASIYDQSDQQTVGGKKSGVTQAGVLKKAGRVQVQATEVDLDHSSDIAAPGWVVIKNTGSTDRVDYGFATATYDMSLEPGESSTFRIISTGAARIFLKAEGSNDFDNVEYAFYEL